jgi:hypothetical protein
MMLQALGARPTTPELKNTVEACKLVAQGITLSSETLDFSYLISLDEDSQTATLRFDLTGNSSPDTSDSGSAHRFAGDVMRAGFPPEDSGAKLPETLAKIRLVVSSCAEAGASLLTIQLVDQGKTTVVDIKPSARDLTPLEGSRLLSPGHPYSR